MMQKSTKNADHFTRTLNATIVWGGALLSTVMCAALSIVSLPAAIFAFGLSLLAFTVLHEAIRRRAWEANAQKKLPTFEHTVKIAALQNTVDAHAQKLRSIDKLVHENRQRLKAGSLVNDRATLRRTAQKKTIISAATRLNALALCMAFTKVAQKPKMRGRGKSYADIVKNTFNIPAANKALGQSYPKHSKSVPHKNVIPKQIAANDESPLFYNALSDTVINEMVSASVRRNDIAVFTQNIMRLPQHNIRAVEVFSRVRSRLNHYIPAARYIDLARENKTLDVIEPLLLMRCLDALKHNAQGEKSTQKTTYFINITPASLKNKVFMARLLGFLKHNRALAPSLVFEMPQAEFDAMSDGVMDIIKGLGKLGCVFSLDHVRSFKLSPATLQALRVHFIKVDAAALMKIIDHAPSIARFKTVKRSLERRGIGIIAEKIEDSAMLSALKRFDLHYGQGYVFDKPQIMRPRDTVHDRAA